jgi:phage terminase large subunit-like protein
MADLIDELLQSNTPPAEISKLGVFPSIPAKLSAEQLEEALTIAQEIKRRTTQNHIDQFYPTPQNRALYPVHMEFFAKGKSKRERLMMAANRVGKTEGVLLYEAVLHATGEYPDWWVGKRFNRPTIVWLGGDTATTVRDILQLKLLGKVGEFGTGLIRGKYIAGTTNRRGVPDCVETIKVAHKGGGVSWISLKTYDQGREAWQGTEVDFIGLDEEPPEDVAGEAVMRTMTNDGVLAYTFTPIKGMTEVTQGFLNNENQDIKWYCTATWEDVPHLSQQAKDELYRLTPVHLRNARSRGIPSIGVGAIYPIDIESLLIDPVPLPNFWPRGYGLDVGWNRTAALWAAIDRESDTMYVYDEHYQGEQSPVIHASAIKRRGPKLLGQIDPAARGRSQSDGQQLLKQYQDEGLRLAIANNAVESGIFEVYQRAIEGRLKIFRNCVNLAKEWPLYHRDKKGQVVKVNDHLLDTLRYLSLGHAQITYTNAEGNFAYTPGGARYLTSLPPKKYRGKPHD